MPENRATGVDGSALTERPTAMAHRSIGRKTGHFSPI
jgi:hypothetical protein